MKTFRQLSEATNPMAVHAYPSGKNEFTVHAIGSKVTHVKPGDKLTSSDLDDLTDAGHKVKEVKKPMNEAKMAGWKCDCGCMNNSSSKECKECNTARPMNEAQIEQIDEIGDTQRGKHALADYVKSASNDLRNTALQHGSIKKMNKRSTGIQRAVDTLAKEEVENVDEGLGKTLAAGALALGIGAGASASMGNDKPVHYQVQKIGNEYNVYHKNNVGGKVHFSSKNKDDAMKWAMQKEEVELDESGLSTKTLSNYSVKASAATTDKDLPIKKTGNRYAGVSKVDKILAMRDKKKVD